MERFFNSKAGSRFFYVQLLLIPLILFSSFSGCEKEEEDEAMQSDFVSVDPDGELIFSSVVSSDTLVVKSCGTWNVLVSELPEWVYVEPSGGENGEKLVISVSKNSSVEMRTTTLTLQCGEAEAVLPISQYGHVETNYVNLRFGEPGVSVGYSSAGTLSVSYADGVVPSVSSYQAIVLPQEYDYDIRVIESVNASGNTLQMQTSQGNMCDLFRNVSFTLSTDPSASTRSSDGSPIYTPVSYGTVDADGHYTELYRREGHTRAYFQNGDTLWSFHTDFDDEDILSGAAGRLYWEKCSFDAGLQGEFFFNFGEKQITEVRRKGDIKRFSYRLTGGVEVDMKLHYRYEYEYREENDEIMKENIFPTRTFKFMVGNVPVFLNVDTHLGGYTLFESEGRADATVGVKMGNKVSMGVEWTPESGAQPLGPDVTPSFEVYPPTFEAEASAEAKVSYYPRIEIELYKFFGPWAEPRPYIKSSVEAGTRLSADGNNHVGWQAQTHNGMDLRLGLGLDIFGWQTDLYESPLFNPVKDRLLFDAPSRIRCLSPENNVEVKKGEKVKAEFIVESFCSITHEYYPCPFALVNFEAESGDLSSEFAVADAEGKVSVEWTPSPKESASTRATEMKNCNLTARIVDKAGEALDEATLTVKTEKPTLCPDGNHPHAIDLGTGVKWSCCNVGANSPEEYGDYFAWGETHPKSEYNMSNSLTYNKPMNDISGNAQYDAARANWGGSWRMPTWSEFRELVSESSWKWTTQNGVNGRLVTGPNGNSIFLPAAGWRAGTSLNGVGEDGYYWSSTPGESDTQGAYGLYFVSSGCGWYWGYRYDGRSVRPVSE